MATPSDGGAREEGLGAYAYVEAPFDACLRLVVDAPGTVLEPATREAAEVARELVRALGLEHCGHAIGDDVVVEIGALDPTGLTSGAVPLRWHSTSDKPLLFPHLTARLELAAVVLDPPLTEVRVTAAYEPPPAVLDAGAERLALRRLADAALLRLTDEIAATLRRRHDALADDERF